MNDLNYESKKTNNKTVTVAVITGICSFLLAIIICLITFFSVPGMGNLLLLNKLIRQNHLGEYDREKLEDSMLAGFVSGLGDKYSGYLNEEDAKDRFGRLAGASEGIGITYMKHPDMDAMYVLKVYDGSPAMLAGIERGDIITRIDGVSISELGFNEAVASIPREVGESLSLTIDRNGKSIEADLEYSSITIQTVFYQKIEHFGYIEITSFNSETVEQFSKAITALTEQGIKGLIFDLRGNGGGTVDSVGKILDTLVGEGAVMTVRFKDGSESVMVRSDDKEIDLPMAVLTDGNTASAAELFTATIRDFNKGVLVGEKTYGKGVMQNTYMLLGGSSVVLTVAEFLPHSKNSFNEIGIVPDIEIILNEDEQKYRYMKPVSEDRVFLAAYNKLLGDL